MGQPGNDPVSPREVSVARLHAGRLFGDKTAFAADPRLEFCVLRRVGPIDAAGENRDRAARQRRVMSGAIDAAGKARHDDECGFAERAGKESTELSAGGGALPRSDDGDRRPVEEIPPAFHIKHRRGRLDPGEKRGITRFNREQRDRAGAFGRLQFLFSLALRTKSDWPPRATAPRQIRESSKSVLGAAEVIDELAKRYGTDVLGPDEPQTGKSFCLVELRRRQGRWPEKRRLVRSLH
jgi:hypothetical protein